MKKEIGNGMNGLKVLVLSPYPENILHVFEKFNDDVVTFSDPLQGDEAFLQDIDYVVSYGYPHILKAPVLEKFKDRIINLHISYLPFNRGADPNLWSWLEETPKGVTIHRMERGIDTGDILCQKKIHFESGQTLASSYEELRKEIVALFSKSWPDLRQGKLEAVEQDHAQATTHRIKDKFKFFSEEEIVYDSPLHELIKLYKQRKQALDE